MVLFKTIFQTLLIPSLLLVEGLTQGTAEQNGSDNSSPDKRIVGGVPATKQDFPGIVFLTLRAGKVEFYCGGSIINESWVLTAGHCVQGVTSATVVAGVLQRNDRSEEGRQDRRSVQIIPHEEYRLVQSMPENDVALIKLNSPFLMTSFVQAMPLADEDSIDDDAGASVEVAGWGVLEYTSDTLTQELRKVNLNIVDTELCSQQYNGHPAISNHTLCAANQGKDACQGDSGGPLMCRAGSSNYVCGIVSWGFRCAEDNFSGIYARVIAYNSWIVYTMNFPPDPTDSGPLSTAINVTLLSFCFLIIYGQNKLFWTF